MLRLVGTVDSWLKIVTFDTQGSPKWLIKKLDHCEKREVLFGGDKNAILYLVPTYSWFMHTIYS